jgi:hypothetical protein
MALGGAGLDETPGSVDMRLAPACPSRSPFKPTPAGRLTPSHRGGDRKRAEPEETVWRDA